MSCYYCRLSFEKILESVSYPNNADWLTDVKDNAILNEEQTALIISHVPWYVEVICLITLVLSHGIKNGSFFTLEWMEHTQIN